MKTFKKQVIAGIGRALGMVMLYSALWLTIKLLGFKLDLSTLPPTLEGEITQTAIDNLQDH